MFPASGNTSQRMSDGRNIRRTREESQVGSLDTPDGGMIGGGGAISDAFDISDVGHDRIIREAITPVGLHRRR